MKHAFKATSSGKWSTPQGVKYDVKTLQNDDSIHKGYTDNLEKALKKSKPKVEPKVETENQQTLIIE